jgi:hypothetical protein
MAGYDARLLRPLVVPSIVRLVRRFIPNRRSGAAPLAG